MNKRKLVFASGAANTFEWYDYALFGHFAPIIGAKFFPADDPSVQILNAFLVFALGYLMRPLGGIFFGIIGDRYGRRAALSSAIFCMALPTATIGFLPTYDSMGIAATTMMIVVRMLQGLSMGGALTGSISFVIEHSEKNQRGFLSSISMASICLGILLGSTVSFICQSSMSEEMFMSWGWRIPFILGIFIFFAGIFIKKYTEETPLFEDTKFRGEIVRSPLKRVFKHHWLDMIISIMINATGSVLFYMEAIYLLNFLKNNRGFGETEVTNLANFCYVIMAVVALLAGWLSDKYGRRKIYVFNLIAIIILSPMLLQVLETGEFMMITIAQILIAIMAALYIGAEPALQAELYPTNIRNTALSVSYNTATSVFGGTAPFIIETIVQNTGTITSSIYYIFVTAVASIIALYFYTDKSASDHKVKVLLEE